MFFLLGPAPGVLNPHLPNSPPVISRAEWGAQDPVLDLPRHRIRQITIHHTGTRQSFIRPFFDKLRGLQSWSQREDKLAGGRDKPKWADIPYHFYIDWRGQIAECRPAWMPGDTNTSYDTRGHLLIVLEGSFPTDLLRPAQKRSLFSLTRYMAARHQVAPNRIKGHVDYAPGETSCPGSTAYELLPSLRRFV
jgi:hypothetical protein